MQIGKRDKAALVVAGAAVALYALFQFVFFPLWDSAQESRANLPIEVKKLEKYQEAALTAGFRDSEASSVEARLREAEGGLLTSKTAALASAEMQEVANALTSASGVEAHSSEFLPAKPLSPDYVQVPLGLNFQCRLDQLVNLLNGIAQSPKYLGVPRLLVQYVGTKDKLISVSMQITGILRAEPAKK